MRYNYGNDIRKNTDGLELHTDAFVAESYVFLPVHMFGLISMTCGLIRKRYRPTARFLPLAWCSADFPTGISGKSRAKTI
ncbi:MAG TPA: hypothetical protein DE060_19355 [Lentisphaeria bacterium]|nr:hypothetical protein [Lentisphaeria bacterium]HCG51346.1 hypothetical protein [Lentisphaeria bacterium]